MICKRGLAIVNRPVKANDKKEISVMQEDWQQHISKCQTCASYYTHRAFMENRFVKLENLLNKIDKMLSNGTTK